jgi:MFS family permease
MADTAASPQPGARMSVALLIVVNLFNYIDRYILAAVLPLLQAQFFPGSGEDDPVAASKLGLLTTVFLVSYMLVAPVFGWIGDRYRRWVLIGVGLIAWSLASGGSGLAQSYGMLLGTRVLIGIGEAAYGPVAPTVIADLYPVSRRGSVLAWFYAAIPVGSAIGYGIGGVLGEHFGWRVPFLAVVLPGVLLGFVCLLRPEPARGSADVGMRGPARKASLADYRMFWQTRSYVLNTVGMTAMTFAMGGIAVWMPKYAHDVRQAGSLGEVGMIFGAILATGGLAATLTGGYLSDRLRARYPGSYFVVSGVGMLVGFPLFLLVLVTPFPYAWALIFAAVFCLFLNTGPTNTIIANVIHPSLRSSAFAVNILIIHTLGDALSPPLIGWIYGTAGSMNVGFLVVSVMFLVSGVAWLAGARYLGRDTELAPTRL